MKLTRWHRLYESRADLDAAPRGDLANADLVGFHSLGGVQVFKDRMGIARRTSLEEWNGLVEQVRRDRGPDDGTWPCQTIPARASVSVEGGPPYRQMTEDGEVISERLVAFLYRALRDGLSSPGEAEQVAIDIAEHVEPGTAYTNRHLEGYARSLASYLCAKS